MKTLPTKFRERVVAHMTDRLDLSDLVEPINARRRDVRALVAEAIRVHVGEDLAALQRHGCTGSGTGLVLHPPGDPNRTKAYPNGGRGRRLSWAPYKPNGLEVWHDPAASLVYPRPWNPVAGVDRCIPDAAEDALYPLAAESEAADAAVQKARRAHETALADALQKCRTLAEADRLWPGTKALWAVFADHYPEYGKPRIDWDEMIARMEAIPVGYPKRRRARKGGA